MAGDTPTILAADLKQFPDAVDVVRVGSGRWTEKHAEIVEALTDGVRFFSEKKAHAHRADYRRIWQTRTDCF